MAGALRGRDNIDLSSAETRKVIFASSLGTVFEWYDFYLFGSLAAIMNKNFFSGVSETAGFVFVLLGFAAGFAVRPFGAIFFGRLGDLIGRKYTFLVTILIMGLSTAVVGFLPSYATIGIAAPIILIGLRLLQGLALGGEYGGAATYVAEHAPMGKRGLYTSWIQTTATLGLFLSLLVILACREGLGAAAFEAWGWRIPFLVSILLLAISVWIRLSLNESPVFQKMKAEGKGSSSPLKDSFGQWSNLKIVILALIGLTAGQAVVWYTGQFYTLFFLTQTLKVDLTTANVLIALSLAIATPGFIFFGWLSDRIGRKHIIMAGCLVAAVSYFPLFGALTKYANPQLEAAVAKAPVVVVADPATCSFQFNPTGTATFTRQCDQAKALLAKAGVPYSNEVAPAGTADTKVKIGSTVIDKFDAKAITAALAEAGYPAKADPKVLAAFSSNWWMVLLILTILVIFVTMVYGPIAAMLVELFPTRIRYTSMSLPYHIGNGWFGGFLPATAFALVAWKGDIYYGLWYPIVFALMTFVVGMLFVRETKDRSITD
ncbi:MFS transporter [Vineibacter terrae]|uniref:MFS transporter n=1 Tax=Vineibacter terrae TaxID=2586908 RepID=UPI002E34B5DC|nr:MFS transporter [Vineibacter terrae]HEX2891687.1 MFS transporter [Vineibacter terrae]